MKENQLTWCNVFASKSSKMSEDYLLNTFLTQIFISLDEYILRYENSPHSDIYQSIQNILDTLKEM